MQANMLQQPPTVLQPVVNLSLLGPHQQQGSGVPAGASAGVRPLTGCDQAAGIPWLLDLALVCIKQLERSLGCKELLPMLATRHPSWPMVAATMLAERGSLSQCWFLPSIAGHQSLHWWPRMALPS